MTKKTCCTGDCNQGRNCPLRAENAKPALPEFRLLDNLTGESVRAGMLEALQHCGIAQGLPAAASAATPQPSGNPGELAATPRASAHAAVTPMFLLNAAMCIESPHEVPTFRKLEVLASLHRVADELQAERMAAMKGGAA